MLTLGLGCAAAPFTAQCGNAGAAKVLASPSSSCSSKLPTQLLINKSAFPCTSTSISTTAPSFRTAVAAVDSDQLSPDKIFSKSKLYFHIVSKCCAVIELVPSGFQQQPKKYYFVVANAKFMLDEEEHFKELLYERLRMFGERNIEQDFWLVIEPKFLEKFPNITKRLRRPAVALVSTNGPWITFMKLRLDRVLADSYEADSHEEALASNPTTLEFEKPENWVAPYPKYEFGWWETFLPSGVKESKV
ncbi:hypothetical protein CCACVL1_11598 [Corchorus capsularis]|uniref:Ycf54-like protein n=1 Tax=Corchorus capsularis TaxID=210143 RepID=A0A1R3IKE0_COCAP|nr:hypothetical protein CCACVL1_11598 [Corchorus capsularis]